MNCHQCRIVVCYRNNPVVSYPIKGPFITLGSDITRVDYPLPFPGIPGLALAMVKNHDHYLITQYNNEGSVIVHNRPWYCGEKITIVTDLTILIAEEKWAAGETRRVLPTVISSVNGVIKYGKISLSIENAITIGKSHNNDLVVDDPCLSQNHFIIVRQGNRFFIRDLCSTNGTWIDGRQVSETELPANCQIKAGESIFNFTSKSQLPAANGSWHGMIGCSPKLLRLQEQIAIAAKSHLPVLIHGETGSGKELVARAVYELSFPNQQEPYLIRNCATLNDNLLSSELFGHRKGSFTGATDNREGAFSAADGGALFLDELGEMPLSVQPALLRAVEYGEITPLGLNEALKVKVRLIAATHRNLRELVADGKFREDLYYRLSAFPLEIPPLRERGGDIILLAKYFISRYGAGEHVLTSSAEERLLRHSWPGNVRELSNCIQLTLCHCTRRSIEADDLCINSYTPTYQPVTAQQLDISRDEIIDTLKKFPGNKSLAAKDLKISRSTFYRLLHHYNISLKELE